MKIRFTLMYTFLLFGQLSYTQNDVIYVAGSSQKIEQLIGDWDNERKQPTNNLTAARFGLHATDLGVPFEHKGKTFVLFGDIPGTGNDRDPLGFTTDTDPGDGFNLDFVTNPDGNYRPIDVPGVSMNAFEVPMEGVSWNDTMYIYVTTDNMTRSIVARSTDDGYTFARLYDLSNSKFINVSVSKSKTDSCYPEPENSEIQVMFGSGLYRQSNVYLAYQRADEIGEKSLTYFRGVDVDGKPEWTILEEEANPVFIQPCVGELSVSFNQFLEKWILIYNCGNPRGVNCRVADNPWGPWSEPFVIFDPDIDNGYCHFMHANWDVRQCDSVHDFGRENEWGGEYGPYQFEQFAAGKEDETTIYYTLSTWNPYTVVLMQSTLKKIQVNVQYISVENYDIGLDAYPNPARRSITVRFNCPGTGMGDIVLRNLMGQPVASRQIDVVEGINEQKFETAEYTSGVYILELRLTNSARNAFLKIIISR
jgi:hypothetical protein